MSQNANAFNTDYVLPTADGTANQVLQTNGSGTVSWATLSGGSADLVFLEKQTAASSSEIVFTSVSSTYKNYLLVGRNIAPSAGGANCGLQLSTDGGSTYLTSGYQSGLTHNSWNSTTYGNENQTDCFLVFLPQNLSTVASFFYNLSLAPSSIPSGTGAGQSSNSFQSLFGTYTSAITPTAFKILMFGGLTFTGSVSLYGYVT